jgi:hypothetical protein
VAGVVALVLNLGLVSGLQPARLFDLWPAALILLGVVLIGRAWLPRLAVPLALAVALVLVVGALAYSPLAPGWRAGTARADYSAPLGGTGSGRLDLGLGGSRVDVRSQEMPDLYRAHLEYPAGRRPTVGVSGGVVTIGSNGGFSLFGGAGDRGEVTINQGIPWDITLGGGANQATLDLRSIHVLSLDVNGGANHVDVRLPRPSETVSVQVSGGASNVDIHRPEGTAIRVRVSGGASNLTADGSRHSGLGQDISWQSAGYGAATGRYDVSLSGGATNVTVDQR